MHVFIGTIITLICICNFESLFAYRTTATTLANANANANANALAVTVALALLFATVWRES